MKIAKIIKVQSQIICIAQIFNEKDTEQKINDEGYSFGKFVRIDCGNNRELVGIIVNTTAEESEYARLTMRLNSKEQNDIFVPDLVDERQILVEIVIVGSKIKQENSHGISSFTAKIGNDVYDMSEEEFASFHTKDGKFLGVGYYDIFTNIQSPLAKNAMLATLEKLSDKFPNEKIIIDMLKNDLNWNVKMKGY